MSYIARFLSLSLILLLAACQTVPPNPLTGQAIAELKIVDFKVEFELQEPVSWLDLANELAQEAINSGQNADDATNTARVGKQLESVVAQRLTAAVRTKLDGKLLGNTPTILVLRVKGVFIPSAIQRVLIGGLPAMRADGRLVNQVTGAVIAEYRDLYVFNYAGQGIGGAIVEAAVFGRYGQMDRIADNWANSFSDWLLRRS